MPNHGDLPGLAATVLQPGFEGTTVPDWVRRRLAEGLGGVALFARNVESPAQVTALTAQLRAERPDVIVAIDEEAGDVTRFESRHGSSRPGNLGLGAIDDAELTHAVARDLGLELAHAGITLDYAPDTDVNSNPDNPVIGVRAFGAEPGLARPVEPGDIAVEHVAGQGGGQQDKRGPQKPALGRGQIVEAEENRDRAAGRVADGQQVGGGVGPQHGQMSGLWHATSGAILADFRVSGAAKSSGEVR